MPRLQYIACALSLGAILGVTGCQYEEPDPFVGEVKFVGGTVDADQLNRGREAYMLYCYACHGTDGDGDGPAAYGLRPPPRDFRKGVFKFAGIQDGVPRDEDLKRIITGGLKGTAMVPWDVPDVVVDDIVQYIKAISVCDESGEFCEGWALNNEGESENEVAQPIASTMKPDPYGPGKADQAITRGEAVYHGGAQCWTCHSAYVSKPRIEALVKQEKGAEAIVPWRDNLYRSKLQKATDYSVPVRLGGECSMTASQAVDFGGEFECADGQECRGIVYDGPAVIVDASGKRTPPKVAEPGRCSGNGACKEDEDCNMEGQFCHLGRCERLVQNLPPDFTFHHVRAGETLPDLTRTIAGGVRGTAMAAWKMAGLSDDDIWAVSYYVRSLIAKKGTPTARKEKQALESGK